MTHIFINSFINGDKLSLYGKLELVLIMWAIVLVAIMLDLIAGLRKANRLGELHTSYGFRRTVTKAVQYYGFMSFALLFDLLSSLVLPMPYVSMLASVFLVFIEAKSVFEKAQEKDRRKVNESLRDLIILVQNKDNILKGITQILKQSEIAESTNKHAHK